MGYSIAVRCKDKKTRDRMLAFLQANYVPFANLKGGRKPAYSLSSGPDTDLAYCHGKFQIGFDYNSGLRDEERTYVYAIIRWVALRASKPKLFKGCETPLPWYDYDSQESVPCIPAGVVAENKFLEEQAGEPVEPDGWKEPTPRPDLVGKELQRMWRGYSPASKKAMRAELARLSELWDMGG